MHTFLFKYLVFGPINSRRLGRSLGVNVLPISHKLCNFDCIYCECGEDAEKITKLDFPSVEEIIEDLILKSQMLVDRSVAIDTISFAGNGEPTLHPQFDEIVYAVKNIRDLYFPKAKIAVLNNSTMLHKPRVMEALGVADFSICKLDAGDEESFDKINRPKGELSFDKVLRNLTLKKEGLIIQSLFFKGVNESNKLGNSSSEHISKYLRRLKEIKPENVMLYSLDRSTPVRDLKALSRTELNKIALQINALGISASVA